MVRIHAGQPFRPPVYWNPTLCRNPRRVQCRGSITITITIESPGTLGPRWNDIAFPSRHLKSKRLPEKKPGTEASRSRLAIHEPKS
jgi:hypothetical protein